jgi:hypothetical protein
MIALAILRDSVDAIPPSAPMRLMKLRRFIAVPPMPPGRTWHDFSLNRPAALCGASSARAGHPFAARRSRLARLSDADTCPLHIWFRGHPCQLRRSVRPRSSARSSKPRPSLSAKPWSSPTERPGRWRMFGSTSFMVCESRSGATMASGLSQPSSSRRAAERLRLATDATFRDKASPQPC